MFYLPVRRLFCFVIAALVLPIAALAQDFPNKPVTLIVPWPAGGSTDLAMRALAEATQKYLGQTIVIDNKPGGGGTLGPGNMAQTARPDGYTLSQAPLGLYRIPHMQKVAFDPQKDFTYILNLTGYTFGFVVRADAPWKTFREFLDYAKANPGKVNYGSTGTGTSPHLIMEMIGAKEGIDWTHVPFKGNADGTAALLGGHIMGMSDATGWGPHVDAGRFRLLVTFGASRTKRWPTVPTAKELGLGIVANSPYGLVGPKGMDPRVVKILHDAFKKGLEDPIHLSAVEKYDQEIFYMSSEEYAKWAAETYREERKLIERLGLLAK
ncbi:MAG: tripartite tricarboxylate transporter substrate binding protein [Proteobacteria bacterium]|nr:tripartite tricarboxylate transporter substrate binding protein [Pseudomonadota bacterium]